MTFARLITNWYRPPLPVKPTCTGNSPRAFRNARLKKDHILHEYGSFVAHSRENSSKYTPETDESVVAVLETPRRRKTVCLTLSRVRTSFIRRYYLPC